MKKLYPLLLILLSISFLANAQQWNVWDAKYSPDSAGYSSSNVGGFTVAPETLVANPDMPGDSILRFVSYPAANKWMWKANFDSSNVKTSTMVARIKGLSDTLDRVMEFDFDHGGLRERLFIYNNGTWKLNEMNVKGDLNFNAYAWHIIRITRNDSIFSAYVDENPVPFAMDITNKASSNNYWRWADGNGGSSLGADVDWIIWSQIGAYAPGEGDPIPDSLLTPFVPADAALDTLTSDVGKFTPDFNPDSLTYLLEVPVGTPSLTLTASPHDTAATVTGDGLISTIPDTVSIQVMAQDSTVRTYTVMIVESGKDASLASLTVSTGTLNPAFDPQTTDYEVRVPSTVSSVTVTAAPTDTNATVAGDGDFTDIPGSDTILVTAYEGNTMAYVINFVLMSSDATLSDLSTSVGTLDPAFSPGTDSYTLNVPFGTSSVFLTPTVNDSRAGVTGGGSISGLPKTVTLTVTAEDGTTMDYTVDIIVLPSAISNSEADLARMYPNPANTQVTFEFNTNIISLEIYDITGTLIQTVPVTSKVVKLNVSTFKAGLYYVKMRSADNTSVTKLIIK